MECRLLFFIVTKMPGLGNFILTLGFRGLMTVIMAVRKWRNWCVLLDAYTGTLHLQLDRHRERDLRQGQNMSLLMPYVHHSGSIFRRFCILPKQERRPSVQMHEPMGDIPHSVWEITQGEGSRIGSTKSRFPAIWDQEGESSLALQFAASIPIKTLEANMAPCVSFVDGLVGY